MKTRKYWKGGYAVYPDPPIKRKKGQVKEAVRHIGKKTYKFTSGWIMGDQVRKGIRKQAGYNDEKMEKHKKSKVKVVYVYPSGKRKIKYKTKKIKRKRPTSYNQFGNPFGLDI